MAQQQIGFVRFCIDVRELLDDSAKEKGYNPNGPDGENLLYRFVMEKIGRSGNPHAHALGEIVYKAVRYALKRDVRDIQKVAAWAFLIAKHHTEP